VKDLVPHVGADVAAIYVLRAPHSKVVRYVGSTPRILLDTDRQSADVALGALAAMLPPHRVSEVAEMADGATRGYARASWTLRVMQIAAEVARG
jgi:hypothetical protein